MRRDFKLPLRKKSGGATVEELSYGPVETGWILCLQRIGARDVDNAFTRLRIIVRGRGYDHVWAEVTNVEANKLYWSDDALFLIGGEYLILEFTGTTSGDSLEGFLTGYEEEV